MEARSFLIPIPHGSHSRCEGVMSIRSAQGGRPLRSGPLIDWRRALRVEVQLAMKSPCSLSVRCSSLSVLGAGTDRTLDVQAIEVARFYYGEVTGQAALRLRSDPSVSNRNVLE